MDNNDITSWLEQEVVAVVNRMATNIFTDAKANTPVGKGKYEGTTQDPHMIDQWRLVLSTGVSVPAEVINDSPHAIYVHNGTNKMAARPMLLNAADKEMNKP